MVIKKVIYVLILVAIIFAIGCASKEGLKIEGDSKDYTKVIKPLGIHEDCFALFPGDKLDYFFESSKPLAFNIHYHRNSDIFYEIEKSDIAYDKGQFSAKVKEYYCMMWTNPHKESVTLKYNYSIKKK
jgi:hypothetical protein